MRLKFTASLSVERGRAGVAGGEEITDWIARAQDGDAGAFERLIGHHQKLLYHLAARRVGDPDLAAECCQEAMISAWRRIRTFHGGADAFRSWLVRIVVNACIDRLRHEGRRPPTVPLETDDEECRDPLARLPGPGPSVERVAEASEARERLWQAIERVPEPYRMALVLHLSDFTYAEIASVLGVGIGTVGSRLARARGHLRAQVTAGLDGEPPVSRARPRDQAGRGDQVARLTGQPATDGSGRAE